MDDNIEFKNFVPYSFILLGEETKLEKNTMAELIVLFCEQLLSKYGDEKFSQVLTKSANIKNFSNNKELLRSPKEIANLGIYIEMNNDNESKVRIIKNMIEDFDLTYDDFTFTVQFKK